ncbi:DUF4192 family protein [Microbacterium sp.]|uniref:DUF4192 family protein n=1 Tax=Microbacterium sp. TaxID=51671 RepID=UPI0039E53B50
MTTIAKVSGPAHFLALIPSLLGFRPAQSLVAVPLRRGGSLGVLRVDLPPDDDLDACERVASSVLGLMCRVAGVDAMIAVVYTDASARPALPSPRLVDALLRACDVCGLPVADVLVVGADGWGSPFDPLHPEEARPLEEIETADAAGLPPVTQGQTDGADLPATTAAQRKATGAALAHLRSATGTGRRRKARPVEPEVVEAAHALADPAALAEHALRDDMELTPLRAATLAACLGRPALRDVALVCWAEGLDAGKRAVTAQQAWEDGEEYPPELALILWGDAPRPDAARLRAALELVRHVAALTPRSYRAGALAACGWLAWALGRSTHAECYATAALAIDPAHGLGRIVLSFVSAGHLPEWAFTPPAAD